ncbi:sterol desaturase family protein [Pseudoalteromonas sp. DL2-H2.2]|uniref:sterol desaturase family protein n=1 Tax=Pseudoalteromonas sp. DL2-H2.2 TaxID=2908889 RepID=UPI001F1939FE|nr:sterol desaturase family protein [Pseudoalteromonas sp. DL2-H2.2]MCF2909593.1 sterol desaturase family protein [Pseudoalteromonas sp. DL2-H2.2]
MQYTAELIFELIQVIELLLVYPVAEILSNESVFIATNLFIAILCLHYKKRKQNKRLSWKTLKGAFLSSRIWWSQSSRIDYVSLIVNSFCLASAALLIDRYLSGGAVKDSLFVSTWLESVAGPSELDLTPQATVALTTIIAFMVFDFFNYWYHRVLHQSPDLWRIHSRHHSATNLTPFTNFRAHPLEAILRLPITYFASMLVAGLCSYSLGQEASEMLILGTNLFAFGVLLLGGTLVHSHIFLRFPRWLSYLIVSPAMHQVHHSCKPAHRNKNYGSNLAIWDWMFGTIYLPKSEEKVVFGLSQSNRAQPSTSAFFFGKNINRQEKI